MLKKIAIVAGGDSSEYEVSLRSAAGLKKFIDPDRYETTVVCLHGALWEALPDDGGRYPIDRNDFSYVRDGERKTFDYAYITIHGTPGENGLIQGYFDLIGMPYSSCSALVSALTFNKFTCNQYLKGFGVSVADCLLLRNGERASADDVRERIGFPCFVKTTTGGSSFGVTKVKDQTLLDDAIDTAYKHGNEVMIEAYMKGTEITCGCYKSKTKSVVFPVTEVVSKNEFFDYDAKYNGQVSEITPARLSAHLTHRVQELTRKIYELLDCHGIVRIDYIITEGERIQLLEMNTTPGMTATSFIPQQVAAAGIDIKEVLTDIIENR